MWGIGFSVCMARGWFVLLASGWTHSLSFPGPDMVVEIRIMGSV